MGCAGGDPHARTTQPMTHYHPTRAACYAVATSFAGDLMKKLMVLAAGLFGILLLSGGILNQVRNANASTAATAPCTRPNDDDDKDGLPNGWECGKKHFAEGTLNLKELGASPTH